MEPLLEYTFADLREGQHFDFGTTKFSADEIMRFAREYDPMPFHIDMEAALKSPFNGLIASGPHLFHHFYVREWVPRFKNSVYAGKGIFDWVLHRPLYADMEARCRVTIKALEPKPEKKYGAVTWYFLFTDMKEHVIQHLDLVVLHHL